MPELYTAVCSTHGLLDMKLWEDEAVTLADSHSRAFGCTTWTIRLVGEKTARFRSDNKLSFNDETESKSDN